MKLCISDLFTDYVSPPALCRALPPPPTLSVSKLSPRLLASGRWVGGVVAKRGDGGVLWSGGGGEGEWEVVTECSTIRGRGRQAGEVRKACRQAGRQAGRQVRPTVYIPNTIKEVLPACSAANKLYFIGKLWPCQSLFPPQS